MAELTNNDPARLKDERPNSVDAPTRMIAISDQKIDSRDLFIATREIMIRHGEDVYRLRLTAQNKLILTK